MNTSRTQKGFTLIEVLVALLIFAIGMLGLAGLQLRAHQSSSYASSRTAATLKVAGLAERMRANLTGVTADNYIYDFGSDGDLSPVASCAVESGGACNALQRATTDIAEWVQDLGTALPILNNAGGINNATADIVICRDGTPETTPGAGPGVGILCDNNATTWTIYVDWRDNRNVTNAPQQRYTFTFVP